ncbi:MAG: ATP-grasp fold amidoligase family protein [Clostridiaceae bacterium]
MSKINTFIKVFLNKPSEIPKLVVVNLAKVGVLNWMSDASYLKLYYFIIIGKRLNLNNPITFNEKLQWLKLHNRNPDYTMKVDKYAVRKYIEDTIGIRYLIPLLGVWEKFDDIDFECLPNQFVLKCTHDSGSFYICKDKNNIDRNMLKKKYNNNMKSNLFWHGREWPYKDAVPRIICEEFLEEEICDYKFYCFNGIAKFFYIAKGDNTKGTLKMNFYDMNWNRCPFYRNDHKPLDYDPIRPKNFEEMIDIVNKLCGGYSFVRVDLFNVAGKIYFGELTFSPGSGFTPFSPPEYEQNIGSWINLPNC